ncbi:MAG: biotin operon repressor and biotin--acetyl-CoA carboxylase ligase [Verrucomicrobiota bacterium]|jgi:BirA family biotin operon repressor/biotin-[acetyl-CoA-carboxylase] ligase
MTTDTHILLALRQAGEGHVSGAELSQRLGLTRAAIWARVEELRRLGYDIAASPHQGYRLLSVPDRLCADDLLALAKGNEVVGRDIQVFEETGSTNDIVEKLARDGVREGVVVFAEAQSRGRGRQGRKWVSPARKGLWFSVLLRPALSPQAATQLTVAAATALCRAIRGQTELEPQVKWPNDILVGGRKVAGVLTELNAEPDRVKHLTLGIGLDVNLAAADFPPEVRELATSLKLEAGRAISRVELAAALLRELDADYGRIRRGQFTALADEWEAQCVTLGRRVRLRVGTRDVVGRAEALDEDGALLLRTEHGRLERVMGGDVFIEK